MALLFTSAFAAFAILSGTFEQIIAVAAVLFRICYSSAFLAVLVLRRTDPMLPRPYRAFGFPWSTVIVCCVPAYAWLARSRRLVAAAAE
jgi:APA family basic amino acid/polyamine antiporter